MKMIHSVAVIVLLSLPLYAMETTKKLPIYFTIFGHPFNPVIMRVNEGESLKSAADKMSKDLGKNSKCGIFTFDGNGYPVEDLSKIIVRKGAKYPGRDQNSMIRVMYIAPCARQ